MGIRNIIALILKTERSTTLKQSQPKKKDAVLQFMEAVTGDMVNDTPFDVSEQKAAFSILRRRNRRNNPGVDFGGGDGKIK